MTLLAETVYELTHVHKTEVPTKHGREWADEIALLEQLRGLIYGTNHGGQEIGHGGTGSKPPINLRALDLWQDIATTVNTGWPGAGRINPARYPLTVKLDAWATDSPEDVRLTELCLSWAEQIKRAVNPAKRIDIMGTCPRCLCTHVERQDDESGQRTYSPALTAYTEPAHVSCAVCGSTWEGADLHTLRGLVRGPADTVSTSTTA